MDLWTERAAALSRAEAHYSHGNDAAGDVLMRHVRDLEHQIANGPAVPVETKLDLLRALVSHYPVDDPLRELARSIPPLIL